MRTGSKRSAASGPMRAEHDFEDLAEGSPGQVGRYATAKAVGLMLKVCPGVTVLFEHEASTARLVADLAVKNTQVSNFKTRERRLKQVLTDAFIADSGAGDNRPPAVPLR